MKALGFGAVLSVVCLGCSDDDENRETIEAWCDDYCGWISACYGFSVSSCTSGCIAADGGFPDYAYRPFYTALGQCLTRDPACTGGHDESWSACADQASIEVEPRQSIYDLCQATADVLFDCGYRFASESCARSFSYLSDAAAEQVAADCAAVTCEAFDECISSALEQGSTS